MTTTEPLDDYLERELQPEDGLREGFSISDDGAAEWALRKLARIEGQAAVNVEIATAQVAKVNEWLERTNHGLEQEAEFFRSRLADYHRRRLADDPRAKTLSLPSGTLKSRKLPDNVEIPDPDAFLDFARTARPEFVTEKHTFSIDRNAVKQAVLKDGEIVAGVERIEGEVRFSVEVTP